jgi:hypothetical protein
MAIMAFHRCCAVVFSTRINAVALTYLLPNLMHFISRHHFTLTKAPNQKKKRNLKNALTRKEKLQIFSTRNTLVIIIVSWCLPIAAVFPMPFLSRSVFVVHGDIVNATPITIKTAYCEVDDEQVRYGYIMLIMVVMFASCVISFMLYAVIIAAMMRRKRDRG